MTADEVTQDTVEWAALWREAIERLGRVDVPSPDIDARRIVEQASGAEPVEFHDVLRRPATRRGVAAFDAMLARREAGEPLQYVVGRWGFRYLDLLVDRRVLIPRPETEVVAGLAIDAVNAVDGHAVLVDLGTGSGAIALSVAHECPSVEVHASDVDVAALAVARANLAGLGRAARQVTVHEGSWFEALPARLRGGIDVLVSNPPYVADDEVLPPVVADWEPGTALRAGPDGLDDLRSIVEGAGEWVRPEGTVVLEMSSSQTATVTGWFEGMGWSATTHSDLAGRPRAVVAHRPTDSS